jgi:hypothetical protein
MKREEQLVWTSDAGRALLKLNRSAKPEDRFSVVPSSCSRQELAELSDAIDNALHDPELAEKSR